MLDLLITNAIIDNSEKKVNIGVVNGKISFINNLVEAKENPEVIKSKQVYDADGNFLCSGFFESHIHLDKACILERCTIEEGTLDEAVEETGKTKKEFTEEDVFERANRVVEMAIKKKDYRSAHLCRNRFKNAVALLYSNQENQGEIRFCHRHRNLCLYPGRSYTRNGNVRFTQEGITKWRRPCWWLPLQR